MLYSVAGDAAFVRQEVLPAIDWLRRELAIPDAAERAAARATNGTSSSTGTGGGEDDDGDVRYALFAERALEADLARALPFFDLVLWEDDFRIDALHDGVAAVDGADGGEGASANAGNDDRRASPRVAHRVKAVKARSSTGGRARHLVRELRGCEDPPRE